MASSGSDKSSSAPSPSTSPSDTTSSSSSSSSNRPSSSSSRSSQTADVSSQTSDEFYQQTQRKGGVPRALRRFRRESSSSFQDSVGEEITKPAIEKRGIDIALQTEMSWLQDLHERRSSLSVRDSMSQGEIEEEIPASKKKTRIKNLKTTLQKIAAARAFGSFTHGDVSPTSYCPLIRARWSMNERMKKLDILCDMEFKEEFEMFFEPLLETIPKVGPPAILAYKPEPPPQDIILEWETEYTACCEFCGHELRPFPSLDNIDFDPESYENLFCCLEFKRLFEYVLHERNLIKSMYPESDLISIAPHAAFGSEQERLKAKEKALRRQQERQMARTFAFMSSDQEEVGIKQLRTITYQLARNPSIKVTKEDQLGDSLEEQCTFSIESGDIWTLPCLKKIEKEFLEKYYKDGGKFLTMFPDGTAQIFYPSGNLAAVVTSRKNGFICVIQEDTTNKPAIRAIFDSRGKITCYYPNGNIWININLLGGQFSDQEGNRVRTWKWSTTMTSLPFVSFKPIFLSLNNYVGVRILDQDKVIVSFLALGQQARMNVGTKLKVRIYEEVPKLRYFTDEDLFLLAFIIRIRRLLSKIEILVNFPSIENWYKLKTPSYLATRAVKLLSLCQYYELGKDAISTITALLNEPI
ncbi:glutamate-rich protein 6 [Dromiciops gliroides]|uniref:glutamate-rich protein 6 n=1 Tax=Dromiciops gliroides TaxID=33562 RepID=UPI001CC5EAE0|nr:glutamate-rich protein 6 [Dromiciops gliroides]